LKNQLAQVKTHFVEAQNYHTIKDLYSPVIEYWSSNSPAKTDSLHKGRLYFESGYYENGQWIEKNEEFLKAADKLFRWFKKTFKKVDDEIFRGSYTSDSVIEWVQNGGKIAVN
jgi:hypothetical protein